mgnify:CR=1 FL=1
MKVILIFIALAFSNFVYSDINLSSLGTPDRDDIEYPDDEEHSPAEIELGKMLFQIKSQLKLWRNYQKITINHVQHVTTQN